MKKMVKRKDGSYSQWGLWDSIRANKGSGKKPTREMLEQERKIKKGQMGMEIPYYLDYQPQFMQIGGLFPRFMEEGGEPDGGMALQQMAAVVDKMQKLREFVQPESDLEPWISSKLAVMDHYADAVSDYMMYGNVEEGEEEEEEDEDEYSENEMEEMRNGGIPERYRKRGFTRVGAKRQSNRPGKKWMVLAKKGDQYKIVHGGYKGMQDYTQHRNKKRQKNFWNRMGGRNSGKATDPFSPLYWHKRFGTWEDGGELPTFQGNEGSGKVNLNQSTRADGQKIGTCGLEKGGDKYKADVVPLVPATKQESYPTRYKTLYSVLPSDKKERKAFIQNFEQLKANNPSLADYTPEDYQAAIFEANLYNSFFKPSEGKARYFDPETGVVIPSMRSSLNPNSAAEYYRTRFPKNNVITPEQIIGLMPLQERMKLIGNQYKKYGGNTNNNLNTNFMNPLYDFIERAQMGGQQDPQQDQIMQLIQMYAELQGIDPNAIIQQLQELPTNEQQQAIEQMMQEVQAAMQQQGGAQQGMMQQQQPMMKRGGNMPCFECGGQYQYGGMMDDQYGGLVMPAMPMLDAYGLPLYAEGGSKNWIQKAVKRPGRCTPGSPNYDCPKGSPQWNLAQRFKSGEFRKKKMYGGLAEMESGGKPSRLIEAQLKAQGYTGSALSNKMGQLGKASYGGDADLYQMGSGGYSGTFSGNAYYQDGGVSVGDVVDATPEMLAWLDANGYTYEKA